jgi:hypothetical protein
VVEQIQDDAEIVARVAAVDIGKAEVVCCVRTPGPAGSRRRVQEVRTFSAMTRSLMAMGDWLAGLGVTRVVMEARSDYWKPPFYLLEAAGFEEVWLVNARDVKHLPGRPKTDLLTELTDCCFGWCVPGGSVVARLAARDQRRGKPAEHARAGGAADRVA